MRARLVFGALAVAVALAELAGRRVGFPQWNRETSRAILDRYPSVIAAVRNGIELGIGMTTRLGFSLWYVVPAGAILTRDPMLGVAVYGTYGVVRGTAPLLWLGVAYRLEGAPAVKRVQRALVRKLTLARTIASTQLLIVGLVVAGSAL